MNDWSWSLVGCNARKRAISDTSLLAMIGDAKKADDFDEVIWCEVTPRNYHVIIAFRFYPWSLASLGAWVTYEGT